MTYFVYDLAASDTPGLAPLIAEYDGNGNLVAKYHHDGGGLLAMTRSNATSWYGFEAIGMVRQLVNAQSQVTDTYASDAWGNELATQGSTVNPHRYVGKHGYYLDTQSALMLLGVRYYEALVGRFWSIDPIRVGLNWYHYVGNNPLIYTDPQGLNGPIGPIFPPPKPKPKPKPKKCPEIDAPCYKKICCSGEKVIGVDKRDPKYQCYERVCKEWADLWWDIDDTSEELCTTIGEIFPTGRCILTNLRLPDCEPSNPYFHDCFNPMAGFPEILCPCECDMRVCCHIECPLKEIARKITVLGLKLCYLSLSLSRKEGSLPEPE